MGNNMQAEQSKQDGNENGSVKAHNSRIKVRRAIKVTEYSSPSMYLYSLDMLTTDLIEGLTSSQLATILVAMHKSYQNGQASMHAERLELDAVWVDDIGLLEKTGDSWHVMKV